MALININNIRKQQHKDRVKKLETEFEKLHPLIKDDLDTLIKGYITKVEGGMGSEDQEDVDRYELLREGGNRDLGNEWSWWKNKIENSGYSSRSTSNAISFVSNAFTRFGLQVGDSIEELFGKISIYNKNKVEDVEAEIDKLRKIKKEKKGSSWNIASRIVDNILHGKLKEFTNKKREKGEKWREVKKNIEEAVFQKKSDGRNVVVIGEEGFYVLVSNWEQGIREGINWLEADGEKKTELLKLLDETLRSKAPFYSSSGNSFREESEKKKATDILAEIKGAKFEQKMYGNKKTGAVERTVSYNGKTFSTIEEWESQIKNSINGLNDDLLETSKKKTDLLNELVETIQSKKVSFENEVKNYINNNTENNSSDSGNDKNETKDKDNYSKSPFSLEYDSNLKDKYIQKITELLNQEPVINESELEEKNQNWREKLNAIIAGEKDFLAKAVDIYIEVKLDVERKREEKQKADKLEKTLTKYQNGDQFGGDEIIEDLKKINQNLGDESPEVKRKLREAKKQMAQADPELYFDSFVKLIKEETEKLKKEKEKLEAEKVEFEKNKQASNPNFNLEWDEEEEQLLNGEITDPSKKENIIERIENKMALREKVLNWWKWAKEKAKWIKTKAKLLLKNNKVGFQNQKSQIENEIKNLQNSSNTFDRQAYQANEQQMNALLNELRSVSQDSNQGTKSNDKSIAPLVLGISGAVVLVSLLGVIILRQRRIRKVNKVNK